MDRRKLDKQVAGIEVSATPQYFVERGKGLGRYLELIQINYTDPSNSPGQDDIMKGMKKLDLAIDYIEKSSPENAKSMASKLGKARRHLGSYVVDKAGKTFLNAANHKIEEVISVLRDSVG